VIEASSKSSHASVRADGKSLATAASEGDSAATMTAWGNLLNTCYQLKLIKPPPPTVVKEPIN